MMAGMEVSIDHRVMGGVPCIAGTRIPVATVIGLLGQGYGVDRVLTEYPTLTRDDVLAGLRSRRTRSTSVSCRCDCRREGRRSAGTNAGTGHSFLVGKCVERHEQW
jgi:uncharacterized protein (DUF433 family)